jgi:carbamate kinase
VGGGGIPVRLVKSKFVDADELFECRHGISLKRIRTKDDRGTKIYTGVDAVVDKDLATSLLGSLLIKRAVERGDHLKAEMTILTNVDGAKRNFGQPDQEDLRLLKVAEAQQLYQEGYFPSGSMGPKVLAAIEFVRSGGLRAFITQVTSYKETLIGRAGTTIIP